MILAACGWSPAYCQLRHSSAITCNANMDVNSERVAKLDSVPIQTKMKP